MFLNGTSKWLSPENNAGHYLRLVIYFVYRHFYDDYEKVNGRFNDNNVVDDVDDAYCCGWYGYKNRGSAEEASRQ